MIRKDMKVGEIFEDNGGYYEVLQVNNDGSYVSKILPNYVPPKEEPVKVEKPVEKKEPTKKTVAKTPTKKK